jgi:hypothetical protein
MMRPMRSLLPLVALGIVVAPVLVPSPAAADLGDEIFQVSLVYEQAYKGWILLDGHELRAGTNGTQGGALRAELLAGRWIGVGVEGSANWIRMGQQLVPLIYVGSQPFGLQMEDDRHLVLGANGFLRLRFVLNHGRGEYYFIGGAGVGFMNHDRDDPNQYGVGLTGNSELGWTACARFGLRGELTPGLGALVELGWVHREHLDAFEHDLSVAGSTVTRNFDYVINQLSIDIGWYISR